MSLPLKLAGCLHHKVFYDEIYLPCMGTNRYREL